MSLRGVLCTAAAGAGLSACAAISSADGCQYLSSRQSAQRSVGGGTMICDPNRTDSAEGIPHADDHVLKNEMW